MDLTAKQFELLLCEFCRQDLPPNFIVENNIKDVGEESGNRRQIDTKITGKLGISDILICGEAKNLNDKVGSEIIDAIIGKYFNCEIRANKVILFSNLGYTQPAIERAKLRGIELLEPVTLGLPIQKIPYIVAVGYLQQMIIKSSYDGMQHTIMTVNIEDYIIYKNNDEISFEQNLYRAIIDLFKNVDKNIIDVPIKLKVTEKNILYGLKFKPGFKYNADFEIEVKIFWDYFYEFMPTGVLRHLNTGEIKLVTLEGADSDIAGKVLLSETKINYETKEEIIENVFAKYDYCKIAWCLTDPDRQKTHPHYPTFTVL